MAVTWTRRYGSGHLAEITKRFEATYSLEVFTPSGERLLDVALLLPSMKLARQTADFVTNDTRNAPPGAWIRRAVEGSRDTRTRFDVRSPAAHHTAEPRMTTDEP